MTLSRAAALSSGFSGPWDLADTRATRITILVWLFAFPALECCILLRRFEDLEATQELRIYAHDGSRIVELSTVVRGRKHRHKLSLVEELVPSVDGEEQETE